MENHVPEERTKIGGEPFHFHCHPGVSCYLKCCHSVDMYLFPYDIVRLKNRLGIHSSEFMRRYTRLSEGSHPYFPGVMLKLTDAEKYPCPFLGKDGCTVYQDRPSACRTYPLERGVEKTGKKNRLKSHYFLTHHPYCKGHDEERTYTVKQWERDQLLFEYNLYNDLWAEVDAFFASNPWEGEGKAGPRQQLAFMVCYNIDDFRAYALEKQLVQSFQLPKDERRRINSDDGQLLKFGFQWLQLILGGRRTLISK